MAYSEFVKGMAVGLMRVWRNARRVSREVNIHHKTVQRWWSRWNAGEDPGRRVGSGRPRKTTNAANRKLIIACKRNRFVSVPKLTVSWNFGSGVNCSVRTAYRRLAEAGIRSHRPAVRIPLTPRHKNLRKRWCRDQSRRRLEEWRTVMWSDESLLARARPLRRRQCLGLGCNLARWTKSFVYCRRHDDRAEVSR